MEYGKRKPLMKRKPGLVIAIGMPAKGPKGPPPEMSEKEDMEDEESPEGLTCPKCGAELADTEENRAYAKMRAEEMESDDEDEDED